MSVSRASVAGLFLRPAADSELATAGVGGDLPKYIGAVPPKGASTWDWEQAGENTVD